MKIHHIAIWTKDLEAMKDFYTNYFGGIGNERYSNPVKKFESYFVMFDSGAKIELMHNPSSVGHSDDEIRLGITHIAFMLESKDAVIALTERLRSDGVRIVGEPRTTGDGYFESVILDIEGNRLELIA
jgi:catechol 2,3-dioxygenase-like lactoylglutathione lyase family enzyme